MILTRWDELTELERRTLQVAKRLLGDKEEGGPNLGWLPRFLQRWGGIAAGSPWCVLFALWCIHRAGSELRPRHVVLVPRLASSSGLYRWYRAKGYLLSGPRLGCVGMVRGGRTGHSHTFLVHTVAMRDRKLQVLGIEGNWRNQVAWNWRDAATCDYGPIV